MKYTTIVVARDGTVYDLGITKLVEVTTERPDGSTKVEKRRMPVEYPRTLRRDKSGKMVSELNMPAFATTCSQEDCDKLKKLTKQEVKKRFGLK